MATLKEPVKIFIVQALACRDTPQEVADQVKQEFGIEVDRMQCAAYDPTKSAGKNLSAKFKTWQFCWKENTFLGVYKNCRCKGLGRVLVEGRWREIYRSLCF